MHVSVLVVSCTGRLFCVCVISSSRIQSVKYAVPGPLLVQRRAVWWQHWQVDRSRTGGDARYRYGGECVGNREARHLFQVLLLLLSVHRNGGRQCSSCCTVPTAHSISSCSAAVIAVVIVVAHFRPRPCLACAISLHAISAGIVTLPLWALLLVESWPPRIRRAIAPGRMYGRMPIYRLCRSVHPRR